MIKRKILSILISVFLINACSISPIDPGPQPNYIDKTQHKTMLNILGVLRPGNKNGKTLSFIHLERSFVITSIPDTLEVTNAQVKLFRHTNDVIIDTIEMIYTDFDSAFINYEYRSVNIDTSAIELAGRTYSISCKAEGLPELSSKTTIPMIPVIYEDLIRIQSNQIEFDIVRDTLSTVYDVYLQISGRQYNKRFIQPEFGNTHIILSFKKENETSAKLIIYAYDLKLSEYITYNIIIKPQTYQSTYSVVENGYGCFGSLNVLEKIITF